MNTKFTQVEGLRGIAAFVVLLNHIRFTFFIDITKNISLKYGEIIGTMTEALFDGNFSVWLFWVMSAFVLSIRFHAEKDKTLSCSVMTDAAVRRYPRLLFPVTVSILFAWGLHSCGFMTNVNLANLLGSQYKNWLGTFYLFKPDFLQALHSSIWQTFFAYNPYTSYNRVLWTMTIELYVSFFLFALLALIGKHPARLFFYLIIMAILYKLSAHWLNSFMAGTMICDAYVNKDLIRQRFSGDINMILSYIAHGRNFAFIMTIPLLYLIGLPDTSGILHLLLATMLTSYVVISQPAIKILSARPLLFLGKICVTAFPLYTTFITFFVSPLIAGLLSSFFIIVFSVIAGWLLWFIADRPATTFSRLISKTFSGNLNKKEV